MTPPDFMPEIRRYILDRFLPGEDPARLTDRTPLLSSGIIDSIGTLELLQHAEQLLGIEFQAHEVDRDRLDTLAGIEGLLREKLGES